MARMGQLRMLMKNILSLVSWAKMMNPPWWWPQNPKWYSIGWCVFGRSRWSKTNWCYQAGGAQPTTSVRDIKSMGRRNWRLPLLFNHILLMVQPHLDLWKLVSLWRLFVASPENHKYCIWLVNQEVVIWGYVPGNHRDANVFCHSGSTQRPICHRLRNLNLLNP